MSDFVRDAQQEFWQPPVPLHATAMPFASPIPRLADACLSCGAEFMIASHFCHACGKSRPGGALTELGTAPAAGLVGWTRSAVAHLHWPEFSFPSWFRYLHFHEIKHGIGLSTFSLVAFIAGLGCLAGAVAVGMVYTAQNLAEFQAVQYWRMEWLLGATAAFVAGILLKKKTDRDDD